MVKKNAIVRRLPSVETLGCVTVICSDKTGTLTLNEMTVVKFVYAAGNAKSFSLKEHNVSGASYNPAGTVEGLGSLDEKSDAGLINTAQVCSLCNDAEIALQDGKYVRFGEPTEAALKVLVEKIGAPGSASGSSAAALPVNAWHASTSQRSAVLEFSRGRKSMSVLASQNGGPNTLYCKGAPKSVVARCNRVRLRDGTTVPMTAAFRNEITEMVDKLAGTPLRTLGFAIKDDLDDDMATYDGGEDGPGYKLLSASPDEYGNTIEKDMCFLGLCGIKDPPRPQVKGSIGLCKQAGIRVIMITGDKKETANAIAREIGIFPEGYDITNKSFTGAEFFKLDEATQIKYLTSDRGGRVFSRTDPKDKQRLVNLLKDKCGEIAAMTGDGVNDAPALKAASIGIAMGIAGTEVAKEAADMILADDNFATIVSAVEEGRSIYSNMKAFIRYLISSNIGEVASIFLTAALGIPEGLIPVQLLWVNLVTDGPPATALGFNPADADVMRRPPRDANDQLITGWVFFRYMIVGLYVGFATVGIFVYWYMYYDWAVDNHTLVTFEQLSSWGHCTTWSDFSVADFGGLSFSENPCSYFTVGKIKASTLSLSVLVLIEMLNALNALSENGSLLHMPPWRNPYLLLAIAASMAVHCVILYVPFMADIFSIAPLDYNDWLLVWVFSSPVIFIDEILKFVGRILLERDLAKRAKALKQD